MYSENFIRIVQILKCPQTLKPLNHKGARAELEH